MKFIAVTTVRDDGAAQVAKQALVEAGIPVEINRLGHNPYFGSVTAAEWEVRVPEERLEEAEQSLARLESEAEESLLAEAGVGPDEADDDDERGHDEAAADPALRPRRVSWALVISILVPFPVGCIYSRAFAIGYTLLGMFVAGWLGAVAGFRVGAVLVVFAKCVDLVAAPFFAVRWNHRLVAAEAERRRVDGAQSR